LRFNPDLTDETLRETTYARYARIGLRHSFAPGSDILISLSYRNANSGTLFADPMFNYGVDEKQDGYMGELQSIPV
jgi:hypothetical protein